MIETRNIAIEGQTVGYGEVELWQVKYNIKHRIEVLKQKLVDEGLTTEEKEELSLLTA